jgi:hypothetical protein
MDKLVEIRNQEFLCRERAAFDSERRAFWLAQAEQWERRAVDEIAFHFRECNTDRNDGQSAAVKVSMRGDPSNQHHGRSNELRQTR